MSLKLFMGGRPHSDALGVGGATAPFERGKASARSHVRIDSIQPPMSQKECVWRDMLAELPHDLQGHVWGLYTEGLHDRYTARQQHAIHAANSLLAQVDALCDAPSRDYLLDWIAHMLKFPATKPSRAVVLIGEERGGMDMLLTLLSRLVPTLQTREPRRDVFGHRNLEMARLIVIDEPARLHMPSLKALLTEHRLTLREGRSIASQHRVMLTLPEPRASLEDARRFFPIHCTGGGSMEALRAVLTDALAMQALCKLLMDRPVPERF